MSDAMDRRDTLADALDERGWEVVDTFGGLEDRPSVVVAVEDLEIDDEQFDRAELTITVTKPGISVSRVEITDEEGLTEDQRSLLDDVSAEKLSGPELTVWEYEPGTRADNVETFREKLETVYDDVTA